MANDLTLLQMCAAVENELGLPESSSVIGSSDLQVKQLLALFNRSGNEIYRARQWTFLQGEHIINVEAATSLVGTVALNSQTATVTSSAGIIAGQYAVKGVGQPAAQRVQAVSLDGVTLTLEMESTATAAGTTLQFVRDTYTLPSDFDRYTTNTWWDRTNHWMLMGPQSPQFDQWQRSGIVTTGPRLRWRQIGVGSTVWRLWPPPFPTATSFPDALVFEYINDGWVAHAAGTYGNQFTLDTDTSLIDSQALILDVKWRFWQIKGFSYGAMQQEALDYINRLKANDGGIPDLRTNARTPGYLITSGNVQDGNFPG